MNISFISKVINPTFEGRMKKAQEQLSYLTTPIRKKTLRNLYPICNICESAHEANECDLKSPANKYACLEETSTTTPSILRFYQNNDIPPWGNVQQRADGEEGLEGIINEEPKGEETTTMKIKETPYFPTLYHPSKSSSVSFSSWLWKQRKDDDDEQLLSIFRQIHINLPFLEAMIHMPKGAKVLKDLLSHKEKLKKQPPQSNLVKNARLSSKGAWPKRRRPREFYTAMSYRTIGSISDLKSTGMSIQLADRSVKYPSEVYENLLVKIYMFIFPVDFIVLEMDKDELVSIILRRPFLANACITSINYENCDKVLLFSSRLRLLLGKLKSRWYEPFMVNKDMRNGEIELCNEEGNEFIVNKKCVNPYQKDISGFDANDDVILSDEGGVT
nr:hypothetical protein [Tanacetum cinerariifolium]